MENSELFLRCSCGNEVIVVEPVDEEDNRDFIFSFKETPRVSTLWEKMRMCWRLLRGYSNHEVVLTKEQTDMLVKWLENRKG